MTKFTTKTKILALALTTCSVLALGSAEAETVNSTADVTVQNAITFTETSALTFGTIVAIGDGTAGGAAATIDIGVGVANDTTVSTPAVPGTDDLIIELVAGDRAEYAISGAAPNTDLTVTIPAAPVVLNCGGCSGAQPDFTVDTWIDNSTAGVLTTDGAGAQTLFVGATLNTDPTAINPYEDGNYTGAYTVEVNY